MEPQPNGKVIVGGSFTKFSGVSSHHVARLNADGTLDTTFALTGTGLDGSGVSAVQLQRDGQILVAGSFSSYDHTSGDTTSPGVAG